MQNQKLKEKGYDSVCHIKKGKKGRMKTENKSNYLREKRYYTNSFSSNYCSTFFNSSGSECECIIWK